MREGSEGSQPGDSEACPYQAALGREVSPVKEKLLTTFAQLTPDREETSWLNNVKGKFAKTVDNSREKYQELRAEREKGNVTSPDLEEDRQETEDSEWKMSYSLSENSLSDFNKPKEGQRPQSQIFDFDVKEFEGENQPKSSAQDIPQRSQVTTPTQETPSKVRKKFVIPSLFSRTATPTAGGSTGSPGKEDVKSETPKRSVRSLFSSYVNKSGAASSSPQELSLPLQDPFSGLDAEDQSVFVALNDPLTEVKDSTPGSEVEEGLDAAEMSVSQELLEEEENTKRLSGSDLAAPEPDPASVTKFPLPPSVRDLVSPVLVACLAVANMLLPLWLSGFVTGLALAAVTTYWVCSFLQPVSSHEDPESGKISSQSSHIEIHEPPAVFQAWMNLLPHQFQPYDVDTYEVRNTVSVRVSVEHHMLKIEYPEWNIPKRLNTDEVIPADIKFLYHSDHVDLTKARVSLLPEGIAGKRMFSKKYPIEIRTNGLSSSGSQQPTNLIMQKFSRSKESLNSDDSDLFKDVGGTPPKQSPVSEYPENKVFYLFARADREKEDIYKCFLDSHFFLTDTVLDVARRQDAITEGIDRDAGGRETVRERKANFTDFMARVLDSQQTVEEAEGERPGRGDACLNFLNVFLNRIFYDIHKSEAVKTMLKTRVYNKLLKIKITQWFKSIELTEINMGKTLPKVCWVSNLHQNERGLWVEVGIEYNGIASATVETCGLIISDDMPDSGSAAVQLKALLDETETAIPVKQESQTTRKVSSRIVAATNSDEEDSAEEDSDSQELDLPVQQVVGAGAESGSLPRAKWWEVVGNSDIVKSGIKKLSNSEWFKQKNSKKMTLHLEVSSWSSWPESYSYLLCIMIRICIFIIIVFQLASLNGVLVLNIPPPPSDRLWYSFKTR